MPDDLGRVEFNRHETRATLYGLDIDSDGLSDLSEYTHGNNPIIAKSWELFRELSQCDQHDAVAFVGPGDSPLVVPNLFMFPDCFQAFFGSDQIGLPHDRLHALGMAKKAIRLGRCPLIVSPFTSDPQLEWDTTIADTFSTDDEADPRVGVFHNIAQGVHGAALMDADEAISTEGSLNQ